MIGYAPCYLYITVVSVYCKSVWLEAGYTQKSLSSYDLLLCGKEI